MTRPRVDEDLKSKPFTISIKPDIKEMLKRKASESNLTVSRYVERLILDAYYRDLYGGDAR